MQKIVSLANIFLILTASFSVAPAFGQSESFGQSAGCACTTAFGASDQSTGQITAMDGYVLVSQSAGLTSAKPGAGLTPGSQVILGPNSLATVVFGSCNLSVGQNSVLTVIDTGVDICLLVEGAGRQAGSTNPFVLGGFVSEADADAGGSALSFGDDAVSLGEGANLNPLSENKLNTLNALLASGISSTAAFALYSALFGEDDNNDLGGGAIPVSP